MGTIVITKKIKGFKFTYNNYKGNTLFVGERVDTLEESISEVSSLKSSFDEVTIEKKQSASRKLFFQVFLGSKLIGVSRKFTTELLLDKGLRDFKQGFVKAEVLDFTADAFPPVFIDDDKVRC